MNEDYHELIEYLDQKFVAIDTRLSAIDEKLESKADKSDVNNLLSAIDAYAAKADTYFQDPVKVTS